MQITIISIGKLHSHSWANVCYAEYAKRLSQDYQLKLLEIPANKRTKTSTKQQIVTQEGQKLLTQVPKNNIIIALDEHGKQWTSQQLAQRLATWQYEQQNISLLIGGADGLAQTCLQQASIVWSLSYLTLPHQLVRVIVAEQIYRAWSIIKHYPYHK